MAKKNWKNKEKPIPWALGLASNQWQKGHAREWETNALCIKTLFHSIAKELKEKIETISLRIKTCFQSRPKGI